MICRMPHFCQLFLMWCRNFPLNPNESWMETLGTKDTRKRTIPTQHSKVTRNVIIYLGFSYKLESFSPGNIISKVTWRQTLYDWAWGLWWRFTAPWFRALLWIHFLNPCALVPTRPETRRWLEIWMVPDTMAPPLAASTSGPHCHPSSSFFFL